MKRPLTSLLMTGIWFFATDATAQTASCQDIVVQLDGSGNYAFDTPLTPQVDADQPIQAGIFNGTNGWQSFTATESGLLYSVSLNFTTPYTPSVTANLNTYSGEGTAGPVLAQNSYSSAVTFTGLVELILDDPLDVIVGNVYTFWFDGVGDPIALAKNDGDPYAGGRNSISATSDFVFSTKILQRPEIDNGSTSSDGLQSFGLSQTAFDCDDAGTTIPVTLTVTDNLGGVDSCVANVTVSDTVSPTAMCVPWNAGGQVLHSYSDAPGVPIPDNDAGGEFFFINVPDNFNVFDLNVDLAIDHTWVGDLIVTLESPGGDMVTLIDRIGEPASFFGCSGDNLDVTIDDAAGSALEDECSSPITGTFTGTDLLSLFNGTPANGNWTLNVSDNAGGDLGTIQSWSLNLTEDVAPNYLEMPLDSSGDHTVDPATVDLGSSDNCSLALATDPTDFGCGDVGIQQVILTATDPSGNASSCTTFVEVLDEIHPIALCKDDTLVLDGSGSATLAAVDIDGGSSDNCGVATLAVDQTAFTCGHLGANTITLTVEDVNGLVSTCTSTVEVEDNETPVITCPADTVVCATDAIGATVSYAAAVASDNCGFTITQTDGSGLTSGNHFPLGSTTQEWTVTDIAGNSSNCSFGITVNARPFADFSYAPACQDQAIFFTDLTTIDTSSSIASWEWDMDDGSSSVGLVDPIHAFADTGLYHVELVVISAEGCADTAIQTVHVTPVPDASFTFTDACEGDATVFTNTSTIAAGTLTHAWDFGDSNTSTDESPSHAYTLDGTYTVTLTVTSDNGCTDQTVASVTVHDSPVALFTASTECEGMATDFTNLSTGDGTLTYVWDFGDTNSSTNTSPSHTYATDGVYNVTLTVTNDSGCVTASTVPVTVNDLPDVSFTFEDVCEGIEADFLNTSDSGTTNWDLGDGASSTLSDVSHAYGTFGTYDVTLTVTNAEFCINSLTQQIEVYDLPDFTLTPTDVLCYGESSGSVVAVAQGNPAAPWTLSINGGTPQASVIFNDLPAGSYAVTAVDTNGCEFSVSTMVSQPSDTLGLDLNAVSHNLCNGDTSGLIAVHGTGGTPPYGYSVDGGASQLNGSFTGLEAGTHAIRITDANSCVFDTTIVLTEPDTLILDLVNAEDLLCNGDSSGAIAVVAGGGVPPYTYNLNGGAFAEDTVFNHLAAASYIVGVMDANGCTDTLHVTLSEPGVLQLSLINTSDALCFAEANASIEVAAASGTPPYQYSLDGVNFQGPGLFEGLSADTYTITVMDANGCLDELTETVFEPSLLTIETTSVPVACFGDTTGQIGILAGGGAPGYLYSIDGGATMEANGGLYSDLATGNYLAVVQDSNGCTASEGVVISQPASAFELGADVVDAGCLGDSSGVVTLVGSGGTPTYLYSSDNSVFDASNVFDGYPAGVYMLFAQDLNGCLDSVEVTVGEPGSAVSIVNVFLADPACPNEASGTATVQATGGTPGYTYSSDGGNSYQSGQILEGLNGGNHLIAVMDENGCVAFDTITLVSPPLLAITTDTIVHVACEGDVTGEIHVTATGGTPSYNYTLNGSNLQSNGDYLNLTNGVYTIGIMDVNGCTYSEDVTVEALQMLPVADFSFTVSGTAVLFDNESQFGSSYHWQFADDSTSTEENPVHVYDADGNYHVTLTVTNECGIDSITLLVSTINTGVGGGDEEASFNLYPNPTSSELFIQAASGIPGNLLIDVVSTQGQLVRSFQVSGTAVTSGVRFDVSDLTQGIYYLRIIGDGQQSVLRFDVIR